MCGVVADINPSPNPIALFGLRDGASISSGVGARMYHVYIYQPGVVNIDLYLCYRKSDNEAGMYDIVNNGFYINQGTGSFIVGNPV